MDVASPQQESDDSVDTETTRGLNSNDQNIRKLTVTGIALESGALASESFNQENNDMREVISKFKEHTVSAIPTTFEILLLGIQGYSKRKKINSKITSSSPVQLPAAHSLNKYNTKSNRKTY
jgi:hypothetical protein